MAVSFTQVGYLTLTYSLIDKSENRSQILVNLSNTTTLADARTFAAALGGKIELATDAEIESFSLTSSSRAVGAAAPVAGGNVEQKGRISLQTAAGKIATVTIPAPKVAAMTSNERALLVGDAIIDDITDLLVNGDGTVSPCDSNGADLIAVTDTKIFHRRSSVG
jgi:predicted transcriptional regulator